MSSNHHVLCVAGLCVALLASAPVIAHHDQTYRFATFNSSLNRNNAGDLATELASGQSTQARSIAEIVQKIDPDVLLLNEFDVDLSGQTAEDFQTNFLEVSQNGQQPVHFPYVYVADSNTGVASGADLDGNGIVSTDADIGTADYANDSQGFGFFPGQYGFVVFSKHPIQTRKIRTFQHFLWRDMPNNLLTDDPTADNLRDYYSEEAIDVLRLSSKNHVDIPVKIKGRTVHVLAAHPTPPVFDGPEDRNGKRNFDEIRFWADYVSGACYMYDDQGRKGGLNATDRFVIMGDYNADPFDGDSFASAALQLVDNPLIQGSATEAAITPTSAGGAEQAVVQGGDNDLHLGDPAFDTGDFGFAGAGNPDISPGNLRVDYVLPSKTGLSYADGGVFWPDSADPDFTLASFPTSDHRAVYADVKLDRTRPGFARRLLPTKAWCSLPERIRKRLEHWNKRSHAHR